MTHHRSHWIEMLGGLAGGVDYTDAVDRALDEIADELEQALDMEALVSLAKGK